MNIYDPVQFTQRYVYGRDVASGTLSFNDDYNDHIRPPRAISQTPPAIEFDMLDYLTNGAGRYAIPSVFPIVDRIFNPFNFITPQTYIGDTAIRAALNINNSEFTEASKVALWQYGTDTLSGDFAERAYIFGTTNFELDLSTAVLRVDASNNRSIEGMRVKALPDNFDYIGGSPINNIAKAILEPIFDPYGLGRKAVPIRYTTSIQGREFGTTSDPYTFSDYFVHNVYEDTLISIKDTASGLYKLFEGIALWLPLQSGSSLGYLANTNSDPFLRYLRDDGFKVIYGTPGNDTIEPQDAEIDIYDPIPSILPPYLMVGGEGNDNLISLSGSDELLGGDGSDTLEGGDGNDTLDGGQNSSVSSFNIISEDTAVFSDNFENYEYSIANDGTIVFDRGAGSNSDGRDTLKNMEFGRFQDRIVPLPLEDGVEDIKTVEFLDTSGNSFVNVSLTMPVDMLDRDVDYTLNISPLAPNSSYNIALVMDTSFSMNGVPLQQTKDAYVSLIDYFINNNIADRTKFSVISFNTNATLFRNLSPEAAKSTIQGFTAQGQTNFDAALQEIFNALVVPPFNQQRLAYFLSDGRDADSVDINLLRDVQRFVNVQAFGFGSQIDQFQLDLIDSDKAVILSNASNLETEFLKSSITRNDIDYVEIRLEGETTPVKVIQPSELIDTPLGLSFSGSVDDLDVSLNAENKITAEVFYTDPNLPSTPVNFTVASGGEPITNAIPSEPQNETISVNVETSSNNNEYNASTPLESEPALFTRILDGSSGNDTIRLGTFDLGANGEAGDDKITGNNYDNLLNGGDGDDTIAGGRGNDQITITDNGRNDIDGGDGIDTVIYAGNKLSGNSYINKIGGQAVTVDGADVLTYVEFVQYSDVRISTQTLQVTPIIQVGEVAVAEGNSGNTEFQLTFDLSTPAPVDVQFNYSTEDFEALAGEDYVATSGQLIIPAGETTAAIDIEVIGDSSFELDERFAVSLSEASGATFINDETEYAIPIAIENDDDEESNEEPEIEYVTLNGDENDNNLVGSIENEILLGYEGNDTLIGNEGKDVLVGSDGNDSLSGGENDDLLIGNEGNDTIEGGSGKDDILPGSGTNTIDGGTGIDTAIYTDLLYEDGNIPLSKTGNSVTVNNTDTLVNVEFIQFADAQISTDTLEIVPDPEPPTNSSTIGEYGVIANLTHELQTINLSNSFTNPVVFVQPLSNNESDPATVRLENINSNSFNLQIQEPSNLDGIHSAEQVSYLVLEAGTWQLPNGETLEVGTTTSNELISANWQNIAFSNSFSSTPAVFSQVQTNNDPDFVQTRQRNLTSNGFQFGMEEAEAEKNSTHGTEQLGWFALSSGTGNWSGNNYQAGNTPDTITHNWRGINWSAEFTTAPQLFASLSSYDGADSAGVRYQNLDADRVVIKVSEDTTKDSEIIHTTERVSYFALEGSGLLEAQTIDALPILEGTDITVIEGDTGSSMAQFSFNLDSPSTEQVQFNYTTEDVDAIAGFDYIATSGTVTIPAGSTTGIVEVEILGDLDFEADETFKINLSAISGATFADNQSEYSVLGTVTNDDFTNVIGEYGTIDNLTHELQTINLSNNFTNPVVFVQPLSNNESDPAAVRLQDINSNSFNLQITEPSNLDGIHIAEQVSYLVLEAGTWQLPNGETLEVGTTTSDELISTNWQNIAFSNSFDSTPAVFSQVQTNNDPDFVQTRQRNLTSNGFQFGMEEAEINKNSTHGTEQLGWFALSSGSGNWSGNNYQAGNTPNTITHNWRGINWNAEFATTPQFLASLSSYDGTDSAGVRYQSLDADRVAIKVSEDTTKDSEIIHTTERVSYFALEGSGLLEGEAPPALSIIQETDLTLTPEKTREGDLDFIETETLFADSTNSTNEIDRLTEFDLSFPNTSNGTLAGERSDYSFLSDLENNSNLLPNSIYDDAFSTVETDF